MATVSTSQYTVNENKYYGSDNIRHWHGSKPLQASVSGQYTNENFPTLCEKIKTTWGNQISNDQIVFIDTRQETHFELNGRAVALESDKNSEKDENEISKREETLCQELVGKTVNWIKKEQQNLFVKKTKVESQELVTTACTTRQFVEKAGSTYIRFPIEEHGPLTDDQLEKFLNRIGTAKQWFHFNSKVGVSAGIQLLIIKDIYENATKDSLQAILNRNDKKSHFSKEPKSEDENKDKKLARHKFIHQFYTYCQTKEQHQLKWPDWKTGQAKMEEK